MASPKVSEKWDDTRTFDEICDQSLFTYFFKKQSLNELAPNDDGKPHIVLKEDGEYLDFVLIGTYGGVVVDGDGNAGKGYMESMSEIYELYFEKDAKVAVLEYLRLAGLEEFIEP